MLTALAAAAVLLTPPGTPAGGFHWQRIITPPNGAETQQACVVLDAATFANAAPALNDLRLFQDGTELPFIIEQSYDERALNSGVTRDDDRSEYEPVLTVRMRRKPDLQPPSANTVEPNYDLEGQAHLDAHVPVERVRVEPAPVDATRLSLTASISGLRPPVAELVSTELTHDHANWPVTLGANLQTAIDVAVESSSNPPVQSVILEMRRRSLCYQPRSAAPLVLYLGGGQGIAAKVYGLSNGFSTTAERPYATMGPLEPNPDLQATSRRPWSLLLIGGGVLGGMLLLTVWVGLELVRKEKGRPKAAHS